MTGSHRSYRRRKRGKSAARLVIAGGATVVAVAVIATLTVVVRNHLANIAGRDDTAAGSSASTGVGVNRLHTGEKLSLSTPDGFTYDIAGVKAGTSDHPLPTSGAPLPTGTTLAFADYVMTNTGTQPALLDFPADLFVRRSKLPPGGPACVSQVGVPATLCAVPEHADVVNTLGFPPPSSQDDDQFIPPGATYLVRVATYAGVRKDIAPSDLGLYVWNPRFIPDRSVLKVQLP